MSALLGPFARSDDAEELRRLVPLGMGRVRAGRDLGATCRDHRQGDGLRVVST